MDGSIIGASTGILQAMSVPPSWVVPAARSLVLTCPSGICRLALQSCVCSPREALTILHARSPYLTGAYAVPLHIAAKTHDLNHWEAMADIRTTAGTGESPSRSHVADNGFGLQRVRTIVIPEAIYASMRQAQAPALKRPEAYEESCTLCSRCYPVQALPGDFTSSRSIWELEEGMKVMVEARVLNGPGRRIERSYTRLGGRA